MSVDGCEGRTGLAMGWSIYGLDWVGSNFGSNIPDFLWTGFGRAVLSFQAVILEEVTLSVCKCEFQIFVKTTI